MGRRPKNELAELARTARQQLKRAEDLGKSLDSRLKIMKAGSENWTLNEDFRRDFAAITMTIQHAGNSLVRAIEGNKKNLGGLTDAQLEAQLNSELVKAATTLTDEQWSMMVAIRAKRGQT